VRQLYTDDEEVPPERGGSVEAPQPTPKPIADEHWRAVEIGPSRCGSLDRRCHYETTGTALDAAALRSTLDLLEGQAAAGESSHR
jgi:hypothetical protein